MRNHSVIRPHPNYVHHNKKNYCSPQINLRFIEPSFRCFKKKRQTEIDKLQFKKRQ